MKQIKVIGKIKSLPGKKVYLTDAYKLENIIDSTENDNGVFEFALDTGKYKDPFLASICYKDSNQKIGLIIMINYKKTTVKDTFGNSGFMVEKGVCRIEGDFIDRFHRASLKAGKENDLFFDPATENFGFGRNKKKIRETIKINSSAYFLLYQLYSYKHLYTTKEINEFLKLFDIELQKSSYATELRQYASFLIEGNDPLPNPILSDSKQENVALFNDTASINMLIFWASWCGPCRMEIPELKCIQNKFPEKQLSMKSISIDEDSSNWLKAVNQEHMQWQQFLVPNQDLLKIKAQFFVNLIPTVIFVDSERKEIKRFIGYDPKNITQYSDFITQYLSEKVKL